MAIRIGTISIQLDAETASFTSAMTRVEQISLSSARNVQRSLLLIGEAAAAMGTAVAGALGYIIDKAEDTVFAYQKMAQVAGISVEQFSKFAYAAKIAGVPVDQMGILLTRMGRQAYESVSGNRMAASAFKNLGISVTDASGHFKTADVLLMEVAKSLGGYKESTAKTAIETEMFGRSGAQLSPLLKLLATQYDTLAAKAQSLGVVFSQSTAQQAVKLHVAFVDLEEIASGLGVKLLNQVAPALESVAQKIVIAVQEGKTMQQIADISRDIASGVTMLGNAFVFLADHIGAVKTILEAFIAIRTVTFFGGLSAGASETTGLFGKFGIATGNLIGKVIGIGRLGFVFQSMTKGAAGAIDTFKVLTAGESAATVASVGLQLAVEGLAGSLVLPLAVITGGILAIGAALEAEKKIASEVSNTVATWADMWHGAIDAVKEDFKDFNAYINLGIGDASGVSELKFTRLGDLAGQEAIKRKNKWSGGYMQGDDGAPQDQAAQGLTPKLKNMKGIEQPEKVDQLAKKLQELKVRAQEAKTALDLVGATPQSQRDNEINAQSLLFLNDQKVNLDALAKKKGEAARKQVEAEAKAALATEINDKAMTKYADDLDKATKEVDQSTQAHLGMAAAIGKGAQAIQKAQIAAEMQKKFGVQMRDPSWMSDSGNKAKLLAYQTKLQNDMNAANAGGSANSLLDIKQQQDAQESLNQAVLQGKDAQDAARLANEQAAIVQKYADSGNTDSSSLNAELAANAKLFAMKQEMSDLDKARSMDLVGSYRDQLKSIQDAVDAAQKYGQAIDYRTVLEANKDAWLHYADAQDKAILATGGMLDGLRVAIDQMARDTESSAQKMYEEFNEVLGTLNDTIAKLTTIHGFQKGKQAENAFAGMFRGMGESVAKKSLGTGESALASLLPSGLASALGLKKAMSPGASATTPMYVVVTKLPSGAGLGGILSNSTSNTSGSSGFLGKLFGMLGIGTNANSSDNTSGSSDSDGGFGGGMALGGNLTGGTSYVVGEMGREVFTPSQDGVITPHSKLGGGPHYDFSHANFAGTDPTETQARLHAAMQATHMQSVSDATNLHREDRRRRPSSSV